MFSISAPAAVISAAELRRYAYYGALSQPEIERALAASTRWSALKDS